MPNQKNRKLPFWFIPAAIASLVASVAVAFILTETFKPSPTPTQPSTTQTGTNAPGTHMAYPLDAKDIERQFNQATSQPRPDVRAVILNHHLLAGSLIANTLHAVGNIPKTIILISPNHFELGAGNFITSDYDWSTDFGTLHANTQLIATLADAGLIIDPSIFPHEHGVANIVPYIAHEFPHATLVPIAVRTGASDTAIQTLAGAIAANATADTLIVTSVDFSHTLTSPEANFHDTQALTALASLDVASAKRADVDSPNALALTLTALKLIGAKHFMLIDHSNAAKITQKPNMQDVTSYITGIFEPGDATAEPSLHMLALGDTMLDRYVKKHIESNGLDSYFDSRPRFWLGTDITLANLEGCFTDFAPRALDPNNLMFTFNPELLSTLRAYQFTTFNLANNHTLNFGDTGLSQCRQYIKDSGLTAYGDPKNREKLSTITDMHDTRVGFVGYNALEATPLSDITNEIARIRPDVDFLIVTPHWGNEYHTSESASQVKAAHAFIDAGADLVLGTHPHVIQPIEMYKDKMIFYSLGNFIFDQMFSEDTRTGLGVGVALTSHTADFWLFPFSNADFTLTFLNGEKHDMLLAELAQKSEVSDELQSQIKEGHIIYSY